MAKHKYRNYTVYKQLTLNAVLDIIPNNDSDNHRVPMEGHRPIVNSPRLLMYKLKGTDCVTCGRKGSYWRLESSGGGAHFNLYCEDGMMMTKDHIIAKSKGGPDHIDNYQPMCSRCNHKKGST